MPGARPPLSVVVASTQPWPEARACLESLHAQALAVEAEIVLAHRGDGFPDEHREAFPEVVPVVDSEASANELRAIAFEHVGADVVAITEDHCVVAPDWCEGVLAAHREHPEAAAIGGAVENGATDHAIDWAAYFLGNAAAMLPLVDGPAEKIAAQANISYKRRALPRQRPPDGFFELDHNAELRRRDEILVADSRLVVHHVQSLGFGGTCAIWFHAARAQGAKLAREMPPGKRALKALLTPVRHPGAIALHLRAVWAKRRMRGRILAVVPLMALLSACATAGVAVGFAFGAGDSPRHIR